MSQTAAVSIEYDQDSQSFKVAIAGQPLIEFETYEDAQDFCEDHNFMVVDNGVSFAAHLGDVLVRWSEGLTTEQKRDVLLALLATTGHVWDQNAGRIINLLADFVEECR